MTGDATWSASVSPISIDPEAMHGVRSSAYRLTRRTDAFISALHRNVGALIPEVAATMAGTGRPFCERLARAVLWVALTDQPPDVVAGALRQAGAANWREGFADADYVSVAHALVRTVRDLSEQDWSTSMGSAWIACFLWMRPHLLAGARRAAADLAAAGPGEGAPPAAQHAERGLSDGGLAAALANGETDGPDRDPAVALPDDEDDEVGYGQLMVSMTRSSRRERPRNAG